MRYERTRILRHSRLGEVRTSPDRTASKAMLGGECPHALAPIAVISKREEAHRLSANPSRARRAPDDLAMTSSSAMRADGSHVAPDPQGWRASASRVRLSGHQPTMAWSSSTTIDNHILVMRGDGTHVRQYGSGQRRRVSAQRQAGSFTPAAVAGQIRFSLVAYAGGSPHGASERGYEPTVSPNGRLIAFRQLDRVNPSARKTSGSCAATGRASASSRRRQTPTTRASTSPRCGRPTAARSRTRPHEQRIRGPRSRPRAVRTDGTRDHSR